MYWSSGAVLFPQTSVMFRNFRHSIRMHKHAKSAENPVNHWIFSAFKRSDRDSNSGYPFGVYTLSRRASSATRASLLNPGAKVWLMYGLGNFWGVFFLHTAS